MEGVIRMVDTHYPDFDVLAEQRAWDAFSRSVVLKRLEPGPATMLRPDETETLRAVARNLLYESRPDVLHFVVSHIDEQLAAPIGESDRKAPLPPQDVLVRRGLAALERAAAGTQGVAFAKSKPETQFHILQQLQKGKLPLPGEFTDVPQKDLFKKLLLLAVDAFASHPAVWSEIGYPGPAYPRGYYRTERHRRDEWEAVARTETPRGGTQNGKG